MNSSTCDASSDSRRMGSATFELMQQTVFTPGTPQDRSGLGAPVQSPENEVVGMRRQATDEIRHYRHLDFGGPLDGDVTGDEESRRGGNEELSQPGRQRIKKNVIPASSTTVDDDEEMGNVFVDCGPDDPDDIAEPSLPNDDSDGNDAVVDFGSSDVKDSASGPTPTVSQAKFRSQTSNAAPGNGSPGQLADPTMDIDELTPSKTVNRVLDTPHAREVISSEEQSDSFGDPADRIRAQEQEAAAVLAGVTTNTIRIGTSKSVKQHTGSRDFLDTRTGTSWTAAETEFVPLLNQSFSLSERRRAIGNRTSDNARKLRQQAELQARGAPPDPPPLPIVKRFEEADTLPPYQWLPETQGAAVIPPSAPLEPSDPVTSQDPEKNKPMEIEEDEADEEEDVLNGDAQSMAAKMMDVNQNQEVERFEAVPSTVTTTASPALSSNVPGHRRLKPTVLRSTHSHSDIQADRNGDEEAETGEALDETHRDGEGHVASVALKKSVTKPQKNGQQGLFVAHNETRVNDNGNADADQTLPPASITNIDGDGAPHSPARLALTTSPEPHDGQFSEHKADSDAANDLQEAPEDDSDVQEPPSPLRTALKRKHSSRLQPQTNTDKGKFNLRRSAAPSATQTGKEARQRRRDAGKRDVRLVGRHAKAIASDIRAAAATKKSLPLVLTDPEDQVECRSGLRSRSTSKKASSTRVTSRLLEGYVFCISTVMKSEKGSIGVKEQLKETIESHSGELVDDLFEVYEEPTRQKDTDRSVSIQVKKYQDHRGIFILQPGPQSHTAKVLLGLALGIPCLSAKYIEDAVDENNADIWRHYVLSQGKSKYLDTMLSQSISAEARTPLSAPRCKDIFSGKSFTIMDPSMQGNPDVVYMDLLLLMGAKSVRKVIKKPIGSELSGVDFHLMRDKAKESVGPGVPVVSTEWVRECLLLGRCLPVDCLDDKNDKGRPQTRKKSRTST